MTTSRHNSVSRHIINDTADLLEAAAEELEVHGWCRRRLQNEQGELCLDGAILCALTGEPSLGQGLYSPYNPKQTLQESTALRALSLELGIEDGYNSPIYWNDNICESKEEAIELLKKAAKHYREVNLND